MKLTWWWGWQAICKMEIIVNHKLIITVKGMKHKCNKATDRCLYIEWSGRTSLRNWLLNWVLKDENWQLRKSSLGSRNDENRCAEKERAWHARRQRGWSRWAAESKMRGSGQEPGWRTHSSWNYSESNESLSVEN